MVGHNRITKEGRKEGNKQRRKEGKDEREGRRAEGATLRAMECILMDTTPSDCS